MADPRPHKRRALKHQGGPAQSRGDEQAARVLARALQSVDDAPRDPLTHGLHSYPARMHHAIAREVLESWTESRTRLLDPFCGSGTVLVEARRMGLRACGVDLNPLGPRIAEVATAWRTPAELRHFEDLIEHVVEASFARVQGRVSVRAPLSGPERGWYQSHVLLELAGLHAEIGALPPGLDRRALMVVFSSMVVKFSRQRADTAQREVQKRIGKKVATGFFGRKAEELVRRWRDFARQAPRDGAKPRLVTGNTRRLRDAVTGWQFDLILTSPPYGGTYNYVDHHARRYPWLGISPKALQDGELGSRRRLSQGRKAIREWEREVVVMLESIASVLAPRGRAVLLVGDGEVGGRRISADRQLQALAGRAGLKFEACVSQSRPDWRGGKNRMEHLVSLVPRPKTKGANDGSSSPDAASESDESSGTPAPDSDAE
ncbi:MAG: DNA methyltransferase [Myxococcota bacterium]